MSADTTEATLSGLIDRRQRDPKFATLVSMLVAYMAQNKLAPDEVRDAAYVASIEFMSLYPARRIVYSNDLDFPNPNENS